MTTSSRESGDVTAGDPGIIDALIKKLKETSGPDRETTRDSFLVIGDCR